MTIISKRTISGWEHVQHCSWISPLFRWFSFWRQGWRDYCYTCHHRERDHKLTIGKQKYSHFFKKVVKIIYRPCSKCQCNNMCD